MKRDTLPEPGESKKRWTEKREVHCGICHRWVPQAQAQRQFRTPSAWVFTCNGCFEVDDRKEKRVAPDAVVMEPVVLPPLMKSLWDMGDDGD